MISLSEIIPSFILDGSPDDGVNLIVFEDALEDMLNVYVVLLKFAFCGTLASIVYESATGFPSLKYTGVFVLPSLVVNFSAVAAVLALFACPALDALVTSSIVILSLLFTISVSALSGSMTILITPVLLTVVPSILIPVPGIYGASDGVFHLPSLQRNFVAFTVTGAGTRPLLEASNVLYVVLVSVQGTFT